MPWARLQQTVTAFPSYVESIFRWGERCDHNATMKAIWEADVYSELSDSTSVNSSQSQQSRGAKAWVWDSLFARIVGSNPAASMDVCVASVVSVVCCRVEVSATGRSVLQSSPTECGVPECNRADSTMRTPTPTKGRRVMEKESVNSTCPGGKHMTTQAFTAPEPTESYRSSCGCVVGGGRVTENALFISDLMSNTFCF